MRYDCDNWDHSVTKNTGSRTPTWPHLLAVKYTKHILYIYIYVYIYIYIYIYIYFLGCNKLAHHPSGHPLLCGKTSYRKVFEAARSHYSDVIMGTIASQITSLTIVYSTIYSDADQRKYQSSASLAFVRGIHRRPVNSPHKWPVTRNMFTFDDVIMEW